MVSNTVPPPTPPSADARVTFQFVDTGKQFTTKWHATASLRTVFAHVLGEAAWALPHVSNTEAYELRLCSTCKVLDMNAGFHELLIPDCTVIFVWDKSAYAKVSSFTKLVQSAAVTLNEARAASGMTAAEAESRMRALTTSQREIARSPVGPEVQRMTRRLIRLRDIGFHSLTTTKGDVEQVLADKVREVEGEMRANEHTRQRAVKRALVLIPAWITGVIMTAEPSLAVFGVLGGMLCAIAYTVGQFKFSNNEGLQTHHDKLGAAAYHLLTDERPDNEPIPDDLLREAHAAIQNRR